MTLKELMGNLPAEDRRAIKVRTAELVAEEMSLRDLRKAARLTQTHVAKALGIGQEGVSRLEKRSDLLISTLRGFVEAMGGHLRFVVEFPDRPPIILTDLDGLRRERAPRAVARRARSPSTRLRRRHAKA
jgi:transcriptional regulator with XRE-family HTH domain